MATDLPTDLPPVPPPPTAANTASVSTPPARRPPRKWRPVHWLAIAGAAVVGIGLGASSNPEPKTVTETRTVEVEADLSAADEQALRDEGAADAAADLQAEREAILAQGRQEGRDALAGEQAAAAQAQAAEQAAAEVKVGPGILVVGTDIQPGLYRTEAGADIMSSVYWARLSGLGGDFEHIIANGNAQGTTTVEIKPSDVAFETDGVWTKVG